MSTQRAQRLLASPILPSIARLAAPGVLLALFQTAVSIADTYYVGRLGTDALAGLALVFPLVMLLQMTSAGASVLPLPRRMLASVLASQTNTAPANRTCE